MSQTPPRPPFLVSSSDLPETEGRYPGSDEVLAYKRNLGGAAGLSRIGMNLRRVPPGHRSTWPHAEEKQEEFAYVLEGELDAWIDGHLYRLKAGDLAAFPAGTGICHAFLNNGDRDALLLVGGEAEKPDNRIVYPLNPERKAALPASEWWDDAPLKPMGPHDGRPRR